MSLDSLTNATIPRIELHSTHYSALLLCDTDNNHPLAIVADPVVDDLASLVNLLADSDELEASSTHCKILVSLEDFNWGWLIRVKYIPVVDCSIGYKAQRCLAEPLPEHNILVHCCRLQLCLGTEIEYLEGSGLCLERNNLLRPVHDGTIGFDRSPNYIIVLLEVDDDDFGL